MSIIATYQRITAPELEQLTASSFDFEEFEELREVWLESGRAIDIDRSHEALDRILRLQGLTTPVIYAGTPIEGTEIGYGPVSLVSEDEVRGIAEILNARPIDSLITADATAPSTRRRRNWWGSRAVAGESAGAADGILQHDYLRDNLEALFDFYLAAAAAGQAILITME